MPGSFLDEGLDLLDQRRVFRELTGLCFAVDEIAIDLDVKYTTSTLDQLAIHTE